MSYTDHFKLKECIQNPGNYFKKVEVTNFDFIHHECRGNPLHKDEKQLTVLISKMLSEIKKGKNYGCKGTLFIKFVIVVIFNVL